MCLICGPFGTSLLNIRFSWCQTMTFVWITSVIRLLFGFGTVHALRCTIVSFETFCHHRALIAWFWTVSKASTFQHIVCLNDKILRNSFLTYFEGRFSSSKLPVKFQHKLSVNPWHIGKKSGMLLYNNEPIYFRLLSERRRLWNITHESCFGWTPAFFCNQCHRKVKTIFLLSSLSRWCQPTLSRSRRPLQSRRICVTLASVLPAVLIAIQSYHLIREFGFWFFAGLEGAVDQMMIRVTPYFYSCSLQVYNEGKLKSPV